MPYIEKNARYQLPDLDNMPADVWEEPEPEPEPAERIPRGPICTDPERYLCIVGEEAADYHGSFSACTYTAARYRGSHTAVSFEYLRDKCRPAPEDIAREIIADYLHFWASTEQDADTADLLRDAADNIETR